MIRASMKHARSAVAFGVMLLMAGCVAAAAGAGAAAAIHMTGNSAHSEIAASTAQVDGWTQAALAEMGVTVSSRTEKTDGFEYRGTGPNEVEVSVDIEAAGVGMTSVTASARRNPVEWDNDFARDLVRRIAARQ
jgi:hypothetical protein